MASPEGKILSEFASKRRSYEELGKTVEGIIKGLITASGVTVHSINHRIKEAYSLTGKLLRKEYRELDEITDLLGLRIITLFTNDVSIIENIIKREFEIDAENCIDKRFNVNPAEFGYSSLHLVALLNADRLALTEYKKFEGMKFEIQIRTILQHAWSEIEHDFIYKPHSTVPFAVRRLFYRMAALLESADEDFQRARDIIEENSDSELSDNDPLDGKSIVKFAQDPEFIKLENELRPFWKNAKKVVEDAEYLRTYAAHLADWGITNIGDLRYHLDRLHGVIIAYSEYKSKHLKNESYPFGWSLMQLAQILYSEDGSEEGVGRVVRSAYNAPPEDIKGRYNVIRRILSGTLENDES